MMLNEKGDRINNNTSLPPIQQNRPALSWEPKIKKRVTVPSCLGMFRPVMGQCCHQCTPDSLNKKLGQNSFLGFRNLLSINETQTRYRGWLVRRVCCILYVSGCKVYGSPVTDRLERICQSNRVREALTAAHKAPEGEDSQGQLSLLSPLLSLINTCISPGLIRFMSWVMLKMFASVFGSIQVNKNHLPALHKATLEGSPLVYVYLRQSDVDCALISLALLCHSLRTPYTVCPLHVKSSFLRSVLEKVGVILLPPNAATELEAEMDPLYSAVMTSLVCELLHEGQALSVGVSAAFGHGGQWLARIRQLIKEGSVPDVSLVPVGISYDCAADTNVKEAGLQSVLQWLSSLLWKKPAGSVMIHLSQPFSLKEMCESGRCRVDEWLPLQDLLLPVVLNNRADSVFGKRRMSWLLPALHSAPELEEKRHSDRDLSVAIVLHLIFSVASCTAVMSTSLVSSLLLYKHSKGVSTSVLCCDVAWLLEELLFRNRDVGFRGTLPEIVHYSLSLLAPHLIIAALPTGKDPLIVPRPSAASVLHLSALAQKVTHTFILEAVGACAVSAMLCEVVFSGVSSRVRSDGVEGEEVKGDMEFDVVLGQSELTEKALQLCHLLPPGIMPIHRDVHICDFWKREGTLNWTATDDPYHSDSDCEDQDLRSYKISQPKQFPEMLFFLCRMLAGHLRALCWTTNALDVMDLPLLEAEFLSQIHSHLCETANQKKQHYESCSEEAAHTAVRTLIDLGVLLQTRQTGAIFLGVSPLFQLSENREKLQRFISQYLYN
ncbi:glycerol-3-phosphate acyltransferase 2, mitochondrial isoform X2 [Xiphophorus couchianus]|uniref:glycerol-3-phosphate acyltransferase 2, mitochondrial isoform X2 n=1 Tax=Xiphophorus couchianus TaxID=32473 RepID=UPI001015ED51|nr:glycerol-3-phosphate acyltransferase 2, mitochondrial-like isoform X2 [Xiphophorus couchianus]